MIKVAAIGECMVEMQRQPDGLYRRAYAGDTFNMAQYLAWLGASHDIQVSYVTVLGKDKFGKEMLAAWQENNINTDCVMLSPLKNTGMHFAELDENLNRDYIFYRSDSAAKTLFHQPDSKRIFESLLGYDLIYASAITLMILNEQDRQRLVDFFALAKSKNIRTAFDTNYRKSGWLSTDDAAHWINKIIPYVDIILPTDDENKEVFGDTDAQQTLNRLRDQGISEIIVKRGAQECYIWQDGKQISVPALPGITVVDTTSAGDSFNVGYLNGRLRGLSPAQSAEIGHALAAIVVQHRGAIIPKDALPVFTS